jgi:hypothetical protein
VVLDEAENRLHVQKAIMLWLLKPEVLEHWATGTSARK